MQLPKKAKLIWYILVILPVVLLIVGYIFPGQFWSNQEAIRNYVNQFGVLAPVIFILIQIVQVVITPLSHYTVSMAGGFIFGIWLGFLLNLIGRVIGTAIAFYLGRYLGRMMVKHLIKPEIVEKYDLYFNKGRMLLFLAYFLPFFPDDEISYLAGLSAISPKIFLPLMIIGQVSGSLSLAYVGNGIKSIREPMFIIISLITLIGGVAFILNYKKTKRQNLLLI